MTNETTPTNESTPTYSTDVQGTENLPGIFTNRFFVLGNPVTTRVAFGERIAGNETVYRTAVVMTTSDARDLYQLLGDILKRLDAPSAAASEVTTDK